MKRLSRDHHIYVLDPEAEPAISIDSGEELLVETWDAFEGVRDPAVLHATSLKGPATGPIYVSGAQPGDALRVDFHSITPKGGAAHMVLQDRGFLETEFDQDYPTIMSIEDGFRTLTSDAARWIGLPDRGALKDGMVADVAVFDLGALRCLPNEQVWDLPGGFTRWVQGATGVQMAFVNGKQTLRDGKHTGEIPGKVIRNTPYR